MNCLHELIVNSNISMFQTLYQTKYVHLTDDNVDPLTPSHNWAQNLQRAQTLSRL